MRLSQIELTINPCTSPPDQTTTRKSLPLERSETPSGAGGRWHAKGMTDEGKIHFQEILTLPSPRCNKVDR